MLHFLLCRSVLRTTSPITPPQSGVDSRWRPLIPAFCRCLTRAFNSRAMTSPTLGNRRRRWARPNNQRRLRRCRASAGFGRSSASIRALAPGDTDFPRPSEVAQNNDFAEARSKALTLSMSDSAIWRQCRTMACRDGAAWGLGLSHSRLDLGTKAAMANHVMSAL